jgi:hypothetical protein
LCAWDKSWSIKTKSLYNRTIQRKFDNVMKRNYKKAVYGLEGRLGL